MVLIQNLNVFAKDKFQPTEILIHVSLNYQDSIIYLLKFEISMLQFHTPHFQIMLIGVCAPNPLT